VEPSQLHILGRKVAAGGVVSNMVTSAHFPATAIITSLLEILAEHVEAINNGLVHKPHAQ